MNLEEEVGKEFDMGVGKKWRNKAKSGEKKFNKRRARTAEFHQQQVDEEVVKRVDEILEKTAKKSKQKR